MRIKLPMPGPVTLADKRTSTDDWCPKRGGTHDWIRWSSKWRCRDCGYTKSGQ